MTQMIFSKQEILRLQASCACLQARSKARSLTEEYDRILAPSGLRITQFSLLSVLLAGPSTISELADAVNIDRTTLTRGLMPLQRDGYVAFEDGKDARKHIVALTAKGIRMTKEALELWKQAQALYAPSNLHTTNT
jgi:DNA-binding MarR family transcriptional regulator